MDRQTGLKWQRRAAKGGHRDAARMLTAATERSAPGGSDLGGAAGAAAGSAMVEAVKYGNDCGCKK